MATKTLDPSIKKRIHQLIKTQYTSIRKLRHQLKKEGLEASQGYVSEVIMAYKQDGGVINYAPGYEKKVKESTPEVVDENPVDRQNRLASENLKRKEYIEAIREHSFRKFLTDLIGNNVRALPASPVQKVEKPSKTAHERYPFLLLSDWHFEELVKSEGVLGLNSYDIPTACRRVHRIIHAVCQWKRDLEAAKRFHCPELVVGLNGDLLTGTLHKLEQHSDAPNVIQATLACGDLIALALRDLAIEFPKMRVIGVSGNHGRLPDDRKVPTKDPTRNLDYMAYQIAKRRLENQKNVEWHFPDAYGVLFKVAGHQCYMAHGNFIPNNLGVVGYGVRRFTSSLASNLQAAGSPLKYAFFGHWHNSNSSEFSGVRAFIGPSLIGTQEYGFLSGGAVNDPCQEMFIFDPDLGHVTTERLYGEGKGYSDKTYEINI